jgi:hypothetical protein
MANYRCVGRDVRVSQSFRVRVVPRVKRTALCDLLPFFFSRDFFPVILTFLRQLPFIGQFLNLPFIRPVRPSTPPLFIRTISHSLALWPRVLPARGSLSRLPYLRGVTDTAMISYYLNLLDSMATTVVVNARFYWILDTGSGWNEHRDFSLKAEFRQFVRRYPIEATSRLFHPQTFLAPPVRFLAPSSRVVTPQCRFVGLLCALGHGIAVFAVQRERHACDI